MKFCYTPKRFGRPTLQIIERANDIAEEYREQGFVLTLRQLYYQFVARDYIPNNQQSYKRLGNIVNDARLAGLIDWEYIVDRTRNLQANSHWNNPQEIIESAASSYRVDLWEGQPYRPEVWIEKDALVGVIEEVCTTWDVPYFSCRGYTSQSEMWRAAMRFSRWRSRKQTPLVIHLGDHDPSGIDMTTDIMDRLQLLSGSYVKVERIALTFDQIEQYNPPPNPAKQTDSRFERYAEEFGESCWELDALEPQMISNLVYDTLETYCHDKRFKQQKRRQDKGKRQLSKIEKQWDKVVKVIK